MTIAELDAMEARVRDGDCLSPKEADALFAEVRAAVALVQKLGEALGFYADPDTWFATMTLGDPPCGDIVTDYSDVDGTMRLGKRAREAFR